MFPDSDCSTAKTVSSRVNQKRINKKKKKKKKNGKGVGMQWVKSEETDGTSRDQTLIMMGTLDRDEHFQAIHASCKTEAQRREERVEDVSVRGLNGER